MKYYYTNPSSSKATKYEIQIVADCLLFDILPHRSRIALAVNPSLVALYIKLAFEKKVMSSKKDSFSLLMIILLKNLANCL